MAKRDSGTKRTNGGTTTTNASGAMTANAMERRVVAFAEQMGRIAGTVQARAEGWMDRETLSQQIASVRDGAVDLLEQLAGGGATKPRRRTRPRRREEVTKGVAAAWSTRPVRNIVSRCRPIRARTLRTVRRQKCGRQKRW
jgi:hypothetical protein